MTYNVFGGTLDLTHSSLYIAYTYYTLDHSPLRNLAHFGPVKTAREKLVESSITEPCIAQLCWNLVHWCIMYLGP